MDIQQLRLLLSLEEIREESRSRLRIGSLPAGNLYRHGIGYEKRKICTAAEKFIDHAREWSRRT